MNLENVFYQYLLVKGLKPQHTGFDSICFTYKEQLFAIHLICPYIWEEIRVSHNFYEDGILELRRMFKIVVYNKGHLYVNKKQLEDIVSDTNFRYRGLKTNLSENDDYTIEVSVELLNSLAENIKDVFFEYLELLINANEKITKEFNKYKNNYNPFD